MDKKRVPERREIPEEMTWDLRDLFESDEAWLAEHRALAELPGRIEAFQGRLAESGETLLAYLRLEDEAELRLSRLMGYANCKSDQDTGDSRYQDLRGKAVATAVAVSGAAAFAAPELMAIPEERLADFYAAVPELETYRRAIYRVRRLAAHILSPAEERLLARAGEMAAAPESVAGILRDADLRFPAARDSEGQSHELSSASLVPLLQSPDRVLRRSAFDGYHQVLEQFKNTAAALLDAQFKQLCFFSRARGYDSTLAAALDRTEVPVTVYTRLIETVGENLDKMHRYVALRKRLLGLEELHMYDVYTPLVPDAARPVTYRQAQETVLEALAVLGEDYLDLLRRGFRERWIDVYENRGKRSGAYSSGSARPHPYVLLNHKDDLDSLFTLAHEMGHALHSQYSCQAQPVCDSDYVIFVAEVASTCNEILLMRHLLGKTADKAERAYLINHFLEQFKGTVYRQTMFAQFELELGRLAEAGETLTAQLLCRKYLALNKAYFGPDMVSDEAIALEWARIPHFFYDYYVFQYATGFSAAAAIASRILDGEAGAVEDYKRFLSGGCSQDPISLLRIAGVDMSSGEPVRRALALFGELLDEMEALSP